jgi:hypothetical protein
VEDRSMAERRAVPRRARTEDRILRDKEVEARTAEQRARPPSAFVTYLEDAGGLFRFIGQFFARFWRRPFEGGELLKQMDEVGTKSFLLVGVTGPPSASCSRCRAGARWPASARRPSSRVCSRSPW